MSVTREFFEAWLKENVAGLTSDRTVSPTVLARQFEQDADAAGYGREVREEEIGNVEEAIIEALEGVYSQDEGDPEPIEDLLPVMQALEADDPKS